MSFTDLGLSEGLLKAVEDAGYSTPTPIQGQAIPQVLQGRDILGCAQTGTGKTASFTLPMIDILAQGRAKARMPRSLILEPTRELAHQVAENFKTYGKYHKLNMALLIGGESMGEQRKVLQRGVDVLIATPGRLLDLFERGELLLTDVKVLVIDEADRMLDMGFIPDVERIVSLLSPIRQTLFFSATMPPEIRRLADAFLMNPKEITVARPATTAETVAQALLVVKGDPKAKRAALRDLLRHEDVKNALVFCNRKRDVGTVCRSLQRHGFNAGQLHGDMVQSARMETLERFKRGEITLLVCSDVAARGIDISELSHVFNFDVPTHAEDYVHRIGRTGRAGRKGHAYTLSTPAESKYIGQIERLIGNPIPRVDASGAAAEAQPQSESQSQAQNQPQSEDDGGRGGRSRGGRGRGRGRGRGEDRAEDKAATAESNAGAGSNAGAESNAATESNAGAKDAEPAASDDRGEAGEQQRRGRNRRGGRKDADERPAASKGRARGRERKDREDRDDGKTPVGLGDHVPAFLMRSVRTGSK